MRFGGRAFALHLDVAARIAEAVAQAGRTAHDTRRFINSTVGVVQGKSVTGTVTAGVQTVNIDVVDAVAARDVIVIAVGAIAVFLEVNAGRVGDNLAHGIELLLLHTFLRHHRYGLRRFAQGEVQSSSRDAGGDGVVGFQRPLGIDDNRRECRGFAGRGKCGGGEYGESSQAEQRCAAQMDGERMAHGELRL